MARFTSCARLGRMTAFLLLGLVVGCGGSNSGKPSAGSKSGNAGGEANSESKLTADFFPMEPGKERKLVTRPYTVSKKDKEVTFKEAEGVAQLKDDTDWWGTFGVKPHAQKWINVGLGYQYKGKNPVWDSHYRKTDSGVEIMVGPPGKGFDLGVWRPFLKFGTKPGDQWSSEAPQLSPLPFKLYYVKCEQNSGSPCAVITEVEERGTVKRRFFLMKGVGIVRWDQYNVNPNEKALAGHWLPKFQQFFEEWKGDTSPLVLEQIKK